MLMNSSKLASSCCMGKKSLRKGSLENISSDENISMCSAMNPHPVQKLCHILELICSQLSLHFLIHSHGRKELVEFIHELLGILIGLGFVLNWGVHSGEVP